MNLDSGCRAGGKFKGLERMFYGIVDVILETEFDYLKIVGTWRTLVATYAVLVGNGEK